MAGQENFAIIGLTGGIASGKSLVAERLVELGAALVDADLLARQVVAPGEPALEDIRRAFGDAVIEPDGALKRAALAEIIFHDPLARRKLEAITHPRIAQALMSRAAELRRAGHTWMIYDAALLVENKAQTWLNGLIVVAVDPDTQLERLMARDHLSPAQARARIDAQMPLAEKLKVADYIIDNNGTRPQTLEQVDELYRQIEAQIKAAPASKASRQID